MKMMMSRIFEKLLEIILWMGLVVTVFFIAVSLGDKREGKNDTEYVREVAEVEVDYQNTSKENKSEEAVTTTEEPEGSSFPFSDMDRQIDFKELKDINPDIIGWISIPGTNIDYPVLQSGEGKPEDYYLKRTYDEKNRSCGSIYMQKINESSFKSRLTILYGHNMKSGTMFADLHKFLNQDFFKENKEVFIYTPTETMRYEVMAINERGPENIMAAFKNMEDLMKDFKDKARFFRNAKEDNDRVLSLYTCGKGDRRVVLFCAEKERVDISDG